MPTKKASFSFEEFYRAFSKSVAADVTFENGEVQVIRVDPTGKPGSSSTSESPTTRRTNKTPSSPSVVSATESNSDTTSQSSALGKPLPAHIAALADLQEPDGSWKYSKEFEFVLNGVAPAPPESISGKLWATAICINVWRQSPECFAQLEASYDKALLHCDEDVLRRVKPHISFRGLGNIRKYNNDEARAIRELLVREAAAKRALEDEEDQRLAREREYIEQITDFSMEKARRLPLKTQSHFVKGLRTEVGDIFHHSTKSEANSSVLQTGETVECCWRRRSRTENAIRRETWFPCTVTTVNDDRKSVHLQFIDGDQERERKVALCYLRRRPDDERALREAEFDRLRATWKEPIVCGDEVARLGEIQARKTRPKPWNSSSSSPNLSRVNETSLPSLSSSHTGPTTKVPTRQEEQRRHSQTRELTFSARNRAAAIMRASSVSLSSDPQQDALYQSAFTALLLYDKAYTHVRKSVKSCARKYTTAILYRERFHAFDAFREALVVLVRTTTDALERIAQWRKYAKSIAQSKGTSPIFVWNGQNFVLMLSRSLDFLVCHRELIEWYGDEFPLEFNPFMLSKSLVDKAEGMALQLATSSVGKVYSLRAALRLHQTTPDDKEDGIPSMPTWWPETQFDDELLARIARAETFVIQEMLATGLLVSAPPSS